jgi:hypothetical protein
LAKASHLPESKIIVNNVAKPEEFATKVFSKSEYPKTVKENIKVFFNLFINFFVK